MSKDNLSIGLLFYLRPHLGGSGIMTLELAKQLRKRDHDVTLISYPGTYINDEEKDLGLKLEKLDIVDYPCFKAEPFTETFASLISDLAIKDEIDIIHANYAVTHGLASVTARDYVKNHGKDLGVVVTSHGSDIHTNGHHRFLAPSIEQVLLSADEITYVSNALMKEAKELFPLTKDKGKVIYNFVDQDRFRYSTKAGKGVRKELGIPENAKVVYHASNFRDLKDTKIFLDVAQKDRSSSDPLYYLMVGDGPDKSEIQEAAQFKLNLGDRFRFVGKQDDVVPYISASDVAALPSKRESFGLALLEAMSCGLPVVGSNVGGIPEVFEDEGNGYLFDQGNPDQLHSSLRAIVDNPKIKTRFGCRSKQLVDERFCLDAVVDNYEKVYEDALRNRST